VAYINDPQAIGSDLATKQIGRKNIVITSVDGAPDIVNALKGNTLIQASASQDPYAVGQKALEIGQGILAGKKPESPSILFEPAADHARQRRPVPGLEVPLT
jgi:ribose transport system substrate-binding protein